jgi:hypothetical protein
MNIEYRCKYAAESYIHDQPSLPPVPAMCRIPNASMPGQGDINRLVSSFELPYSSAHTSKSASKGATCQEQREYPILLITVVPGRQHKSETRSNPSCRVSEYGAGWIRQMREIVSPTHHLTFGDTEHEPGRNKTPKVVHNTPHECWRRSDQIFEAARVPPNDLPIMIDQETIMKVIHLAGELSW